MSFDLDQLIAELPELSPPVELQEHVLGMVCDEMDSNMGQDARWTRSWVYPGIAVAAAAVLMIAMPTEELPGPGTTDAGSETSEQDPELGLVEGDLDAMVQKGAGPVIPGVELVMSVRSQGEEARLDRSLSYDNGDELYFMAIGEAPAELALLRVDENSVDLVHTQVLTEGRELLSLDSAQPLAWRVEPGEGSAIFALLTQPTGLESEALSWEDVVGQLEGIYDLEHAEGVCSALLDLDLRCSAQAVRVNP
jgi:hypothetical protein